MGRARVLGGHAASLSRIDTEATAAAGNYDSDFREPKRVDDGSWAGTDGRIDQAPILVPCQFSDERYSAMDPMTNGIELQHRMVLTFAWKDLERAGLLDAGTNAAAIRVTAKLNGIYDRRGNLLLDTTATRMCCTQARPAGFMGSSISLLICTFECRESGTK